LEGIDEEVEFVHLVQAEDGSGTIRKTDRSNERRPAPTFRLQTFSLCIRAAKSGGAFATAEVKLNEAPVRGLSRAGMIGCHCG
jgi:hypothetical protein